MGKQSAFLDQVWLRKNDSWRYVVVVVATYIIQTFSRLFFPSSGLTLSGAFVSSNIPGFINLLINAVVLFGLFWLLHQASVWNLLSYNNKVRWRRIALSFGICSAIFLFQFAGEWYAYRPEFIGVNIHGFRIVEAFFR